MIKNLNYNYKVDNMKAAVNNSNLITDFNYGNVFAMERKNDFSIIMKIIIASSFLFAIAVMIF
jgi:hypothetical protein